MRIILCLTAIVFATSSLAARVVAQGDVSFQRVATFDVFQNSDIDEDTVSEIVAASEDGMTLVYTDAELEAVGFVDITDPAAPSPLGHLVLPGEPTSVAVVGEFALVAVNTSEDFIDVSGELIVVHIALQLIVHSIPLGGQPDSVAISPDQQYCVVAIENERDEDFEDGEPPQFPAGEVVIIDMIGPPIFWPIRRVDLVEICDLFPDDPEPEFVSINENNIAAVTCQENNHVILIDLAHWRIIRILFSEIFPFLNGAKIEGDFSAGYVKRLNNIDTIEEEPALIDPSGYLVDIPREPDAITWVGLNALATADEGDLYGGSRGFTIFDTSGKTIYEAGSGFEHLVISAGHYPDSRSENKGAEPEGIAFGNYGGRDYLFVGSERSSVIGVYDVNLQGSGDGRLRGKRGVSVKFKQLLPTGLGPEGLLCIPQRNLFVVASEEDSRDDGFRASISIYELQDKAPSYPTIQSVNLRKSPIGWAALSALAADPDTDGLMYTVYDSYFGKSRIFVVDLNKSIPTISNEIVLKDVDALLDPALVNDDQTVNLDPEGLAVSPVTGNFWVASEGAGTVDDDSQPVASANLLCEVAPNGVILQVVLLPPELEAVQVRFGFEGVTVIEEDGVEVCYICIQREWSEIAGDDNTDPDGLVKIGRYDTTTGDWTFAHYPLDPPESAAGGWVGLSEIVSIGDREFAVVERDNKAGADAVVKRIYSFSLEGVTMLPTGSILDIVDKTLVRDLIPDLLAPNGVVIEKVEGLSVLPNGDVYIVTDNDGVDDSSGETQLINLGDLFGG